MPISGGGGSGGGGPATGTYVPTADPTGLTVDTTTYDNTFTGSGKLTTLVAPVDTAAIAFALAGDAFPRWAMLFDPTDYGAIAVGDGTIDLSSGGGNKIGYRLDGSGNKCVQVGQLFSNNQIETSGVLLGSTTQLGASSSSIDATSGFSLTNLTTSDPGVSGQLYSLAGVIHISP